MKSELRISISYQDLEKLLGGKDEVSIEIRKSIGQEFAKTYMRSIVTDEAKSAMKSIVAEELKGPRSQYYAALKAEVAEVVQAHIKKDLPDQVVAQIRAQLNYEEQRLKKDVDSRILRLQKQILDELAKLNLDTKIREIVTERLKEILTKA